MDAFSPDRKSIDRIHLSHGQRLGWEPRTKFRELVKLLVIAEHYGRR